MREKDDSKDNKDSIFSEERLTIWLIPFFAGVILGMFLGAFLVLA